MREKSYVVLKNEKRTSLNETFLWLVHIGKLFFQ